MLAARQTRKTLVVQVRDEILEMLRSGNYRPGNQLPSEAELSEKFGVNRATVREALRILQEEHVIITRHGLGRFMAPDPASLLTDDITRLRAVTEMAQLLGMTIGTEVLSLEEETPDEVVSEALALGPDETVMVLQRVRSTADGPVIYSIDIFPRRFVVGEIDSAQFTGSLLGIMEQQWQVRLAYSKASLTAVMLDPEICRRIQVAEDIPWILLEQLNFDAADRPVLYSKDYHHGAYFRFSVLRRRM